MKAICPTCGRRTVELARLESGNGVRCSSCGYDSSGADQRARQALLDQRVAWVAAELGTLLERAHELTPHAREALLAVCADVAGVLERGKLGGGRRH